MKVLRPSLGVEEEEDWEGLGVAVSVPDARCGGMAMPCSAIIYIGQPAGHLAVSPAYPSLSFFPLRVDVEGGAVGTAGAEHLGSSSKPNNSKPAKEEESSMMKSRKGEVDNEVRNGVVLPQRVRFEEMTH
jgi:hypothetical protein